ncbi:hypothetical protein C8Q74DRAFT_1050032 [Fomes fomentarius]|nr:hypothetical protein C8Q74DRAFT_1050032 [Fomes fomentarius]
MLFHLALLASLPLSQASLSWVYAPGSRQKNNRGNQGISYDDGTSPAELAAILQGSRTLEAYSRTPDCFRRAATLIRARCGDLETEESERVKAALSMTLCEIATADHYSPPLECAAFQPYAQESHFAESPGKCVSALSRSAQYWSSYSGYLREVSQLCFAFQRWNDIDTAKELHRNTTVESIAVLRYLSEREKRMQEAREGSVAILEAIRGTLDQLHISAAGIGIASDRVDEKLSVALKEMTNTFRAVMLEVYEGAARAHAVTFSEVGAEYAPDTDVIFGSIRTRTAASCDCWRYASCRKAAHSAIQHRLLFFSAAFTRDWVPGRSSRRPLRIVRADVRGATPCGNEPHNGYAACWC